MVSGLIVLTTILTGTLVSKASSDDLSRTEFLKKAFNMTVEDDNTLNNLNKISKEQALSAAGKFGDNQSKDVTESYKLMTYAGVTPAALSQEAKYANPKLNDGINKIPVWIVTYGGLNIPGKGKTDSVITENNVVIDATTGEFLFGFED